MHLRCCHLELTINLQSLEHREAITNHSIYIYHRDRKRMDMEHEKGHENSGKIRQHGRRMIRNPSPKLGSNVGEGGSDDGGRRVASGAPSR